MRRLYIGADVGSSAAKLVLIDENGQCLADAAKSYDISMPFDGWKEIDPEVWFQTIVECIDDLLQGQDRNSVKAIGFTGQMHSTIFLDENGKSIRPAIMWNDCRMRDETTLLREKLKNYPHLNYLRNVVANGAPATCILWLKRNEPENFKRLRKFLIGPGYLVYRFTGRDTTDYCEASTSGLMDLRTNAWSQEMLQLLGIEKSICPPIYPAAVVAGKLGEELKKELGILHDVRVIVGTGDNPAAAISTGCLTGGYPVCSIGTSAVLVIPRKTADLDSSFKNVMFSLNGQDSQYILQGMVQSAGGTYRWLIRDIFHRKSFMGLDEKIDLQNDFKPDLLFYPHFIGEKSVHADQDVRGACFGLSANTTQNALALSVMESIGFSLREIIDRMYYPLHDFPALKVYGGGAKSSIWMQVLANTLDIAIEQLDGNIGAAFGIALVAMHSGDVSCNLMSFLGEMPKSYRTFTPEPTFVQRYNKKYEHYKNIYSAIKSVYA